VGFDLYCQLLKQAVAQLKGQKPRLRLDVDVRLDFVVTNEAEFIPPPKSEAVGEADSFPYNLTALVFPVKNGRVWIDIARWPDICAAVETHSGGLIIDRDGAPVAALPNEEFATKDSELLACDVECRLANIEGFYLELEIPGLDELIGGDR
jgi:hypothetical protein